MHNKNYNSILVNLKHFLEKVNVTGIEEANKLGQCGLLVDAILKGDIAMVDVPRETPPRPNKKTDD